MTFVKISPDELAAAHAEGASARIEFDETLQSLLISIASVDQIEVLVRVALSLLLRGGKVHSPERKCVEVFHVEILQARALTQPRSLPLSGADYSGITQKCIDLIERNGQAYRRLYKAKITENVEENQRQELIALVQSWTLAVRGPRHMHQTREYVMAIASSINESFLYHCKCSAHSFIELLENVIRTLQRRLQLLMDRIRTWLQKKSGHDMVEALAGRLNPTKAERIRAETSSFLHNRKAVTAYLWNEMEFELAAVFTFTFDEVVPAVSSSDCLGLRAALDSLSMAFGELNTEKLQHLHLSNPVRLKPFIKTDKETFLCCNPQSLSTNLSEIFEGICAAKPPLKKRLESARADWLEKKLGLLIRQYLPHAAVYSEVKWNDPESGKVWESDVVAVLDKTVIIFEAKSAKISPPARRGALNSLRGALKDLVVDPSEQSLRLKRYIESACKDLHLQSAEGRLIINPGKIRDVIRINILFDAVGPLSSHWPQMKAAGLLPNRADIAPSMSVFELESVFEVLTLEIERCHYLSRRVAFEKNVTYIADELDLLAFYLETQFNVGDKEFDGSVFRIYGLSLRLAVGYSEKLAAGTMCFPIKRIELWTRLLKSLETKRPEGWTRFGHRLLNVDFQGQKAFDRAVKKVWKTVGRRPGHWVTTGISFGAAKQRQTIAFAIGAPGSCDELKKNLQHASLSAFEQGGTKDLLMIYWSMPPTGEPYDFIGVMRQFQLPILGSWRPRSA